MYRYFFRSPIPSRFCWSGNIGPLFRYHRIPPFGRTTTISKTPQFSPTTPITRISKKYCTPSPGGGNGSGSGSGSGWTGAQYFFCTRFAGCTYGFFTGTRCLFGFLRDSTDAEDCGVTLAFGVPLVILYTFAWMQVGPLVVPFLGLDFFGSLVFSAFQYIK